jgi:hypothetical protein
MPDLEPDALAAVAAAYAMLLRARAESAPPAIPAWRLAARLSIAGVETTRVRRSRWSAANAP